MAYPSAARHMDAEDYRTRSGVQWKSPIWASGDMWEFPKIGDPNIVAQIVG